MSGKMEPPSTAPAAMVRPGALGGSQRRHAVEVAIVIVLLVLLLLAPM